MVHQIGCGAHYCRLKQGWPDLYQVQYHNHCQVVGVDCFDLRCTALHGPNVKQKIFSQKDLSSHMVLQLISRWKKDPTIPLTANLYQKRSWVPVLTTALRTVHWLFHASNPESIIPGYRLTSNKIEDLLNWAFLISQRLFLRNSTEDDIKATARGRRGAFWLKLSSTTCSWASDMTVSIPTCSGSRQTRGLIKAGHCRICTSHSLTHSDTVDSDIDSGRQRSMTMERGHRGLDTTNAEQLLQQR